MQAQAEQDYVFGRFYLDTRERVLLCEGKHVSITLKAFKVLLVLVQNSGHIVERDDLMNQVWPNAFVEEANLTQHIYKLRKIFGMRADGRPYIETVPRRGYRFASATSQIVGEADYSVMQGRSEKLMSRSGSVTVASLDPMVIKLAIVPSAFDDVDA